MVLSNVFRSPRYLEDQGVPGSAVNPWEVRPSPSLPDGKQAIRDHDQSSIFWLVAIELVLILSIDPSDCCFHMLSASRVSAPQDATRFSLLCGVHIFYGGFRDVFCSSLKSWFQLTCVFPRCVETNHSNHHGSSIPWTWVISGLPHGAFGGDLSSWVPQLGPTSETIINWWYETIHNLGSNTTSDHPKKGMWRAPNDSPIFVIWY